MPEALFFASTNPQYDDRLFIELHVQYMKIPSSNLGRTCYVQKLFLTFRTIFVHNMFSPCSAKRRASDKDLPVVITGKIATIEWEVAPISLFHTPEIMNKNKNWSSLTLDSSKQNRATRQLQCRIELALSSTVHLRQFCIHCCLLRSMKGRRKVWNLGG